MKHGQKRILLLLSVILALTVVCAVFLHGQDEWFQAAYSFNDDATRDLGGSYTLSEELFGQVNRIEGYRGQGIQGYICFDNRVFTGNSEMTLAFWIRLSSLSNPGVVFYAGGASTLDPYLEMAVVPNGELLSLDVTLSDGRNVSAASAELSSYLTEEEAWLHVAVTLKISGSYSLLTVYVNGDSRDFSTAYVDLTKLAPATAYLGDYPVDEVYMTNAVLSQERLSTLIQSPLASFFDSERQSHNAPGPDTSTDTGTDPGTDGGSDPATDVPDDPSEGGMNWSWVGYCFDHSYSIMKDLHGVADCDANYMGCNSVNTANFKEKYGYALIRRTNASPEYYLRLDQRLLVGKNAFTFAALVYRTGSGGGECGEYLFDFSGRGVLRFSPYSTDEKGQYSAFIEYTDPRDSNSVVRRPIGGESLSDPKQDWVHYALTVDADGTAKVYVNGKEAAVFSTGITVSSMQLTQLSVVRRGLVSDNRRTAIDDVYFASRALDAAEIRKLSYYGMEQYVSAVLPDPQGGDTPLLPPENPTGGTNEAEIDAAQDAYSDRASINGFIGTSFDDSSLIGKDRNNLANATVYNPSLAQGVDKYGLRLGGASFLRYPIGILDGVSGLTVGISWQWDGPTASARNQRLFDFSYKQSSASAPERYLYLDMGDGSSGMRFCMYDGVNSTELSIDCNEVGNWNRLTVTVADGTVTVYLNDNVAATCKTQVDLSRICPNFCYVGRSGVRGDPMFRGTVDEIYISSQALSSGQVASYLNGIDASVSGPTGDVIDTDALWDSIITGILVATGVIVALIIGAIVLIIVRRDRLINR